MSRLIPNALAQAGSNHGDVLKPGETVFYPIRLQANEALLVEVEQREVDVKVDVYGPDRKLLLAFDTPTHRAAPERLCIVTEAAGVHNLAISPFEGAGGYSVHLRRRRRAVEKDRLCFDAARAFQSAQQGKVESRISANEHAAKLWERADEPFLASLAWRESASLWQDVGPPRAIGRFERALGLARTASNAYLENSVLNRLGLALIDLGDLPQARERLEEAESRARETGDQWGRASALTNLGRLDEFVGEPYRAIDRYSDALRLWREIGDPIEIAQVFENMAIAYGVLDYHDRALDLLGKALALTRKVGNKGREANILLSEGWIQYLKGRPLDGIPALERVLEIRRSSGDRNGEAVALDRLGTLWRESGHYSKAECAYRNSLVLSLETKNSFDAAGTLANLGCLYGQMGRLKEAHAHLEDALRRYQHFDDPRAVSHIEFCLAETAKGGGEIDAALEHIHRALRIVERLRSSARSRGNYYRPIWLWQDYAELEVQLFFRRYQKLRNRGDLQRAFQAADLARARTLFEQVTEIRVGVHATTNDSLQREERTLGDKLNRLARERDLGPDLARSTQNKLEVEIRRLRSDLERIRAAIRASDPRHRATSPRPVTVRLAQQLLAQNTALLSYVLGDKQSYLLVLNDSGLSAFELPSRRELDSFARSFYQAAKESSLNNPQWRLVAEELGHRLLPRQAIPPDTKRLIVIPDGLLHYVPFSALVSPRSDERLVVDDFEVDYAPSVSVLARLRARSRGRSRERDRNRIAVFADPVYSRTDDRFESLPGSIPRSTDSSLNGQSSPDSQPNLPRLRYSEDEANRIAALAPQNQESIRLGFDATKKAVLETNLERYGILHFATHSWIDEQFPELSRISLSRFDKEGREIDSELRLHEIYGLKLNANLTVLSGCQTALGERVRGNGVEGFSHGFLYAGSSQVLVSLWQVGDKATALLMAEFYRNLLEDGASPSRALRTAQNWLRQQPQWGAPYYWAPFVLQGDDQMPRNPTNGSRKEPTNQAGDLKTVRTEPLRYGAHRLSSTGGTKNGENRSQRNGKCGPGCPTDA